MKNVIIYYAKKIVFFGAITIMMSPIISHNVMAASGGFNVNSAKPTGVPEQTDANSLLLTIINWLLSILASLAILMIVVAGIMYITSAGDEGRVASAKQWLMYAIVGLVVALLGYVIVATVSSALTNK